MLKKALVSITPALAVVAISLLPSGAAADSFHHHHHHHHHHHCPPGSSDKDYCVDDG
jgi:hypothetical protein